MVSIERLNSLTSVSAFDACGVSPNFCIEQNLYPPMSVRGQRRENHLLDINIGQPLDMRWKSEGGWLKGKCNAGNVVSLLSPDSSVDMEWMQEYRCLRIEILPSYVNRLLDTDNVTFRPAWNVSDSTLNDLALEMCTEKGAGRSAGDIYQDSLCIALIIHLASKYTGARKNVFAPKGKLSTQQLRNVIDFTRTSIHRNIRLSEMASCVHLSEYHFARLFRQTMGVSPYKFVLQMKIAHAKDLIRNHQRSCSEIAYLLNFSDQAHFSHAFKKITGYSPRTFILATD